jgi:threonine dehydratase
MSCGMTAQMIYDIVAKHVEEIVLVEDERLLEAARWIRSEFSIRADLSAAAAIAALRLGKIPLKRSLCLSKEGPLFARPTPSAEVRFLALPARS